ncbi:hypothetical protein [Rhodopirellula bahusiensis]|uniref:hypothetical protein n=1 Tax=Rhodopirellula bahusiensis TaxID=2014065 RepID=UPI0032638A8C
MTTLLMMTHGASMMDRGNSDWTIRDEANAIVAWAFRNGPIEELHAGRTSSLLSDPALSRITDEEMKLLMLFACRRMAWLLELKESDPADYQRQIQVYCKQYCQSWER